MPIDPLSMGLAGIQAASGLIQTFAGNSKLNALEKQRTSYKTPEEISKILELQMSQMGGDTATRDFQTNQLDRDFSSALGTAQRLGADPNGLSALFDQKMNGLMKIGEQFHASNVEQFSKLANAYNLVADNKAAEWKSEQDILKDKIAAASGTVQAGYQNISGGLNLGFSAIESARLRDLYQQKTPTTNPVPAPKK